MGAAVAITQLDLTASELRKAAQREKDSTAARRMLALALVLEGADRRWAAESCGMDRQTSEGLGAPLQCGRLGRPSVAQAAWSFSETHSAAGGRLRLSKPAPIRRSMGGALAAD